MPLHRSSGRAQVLADEREIQDGEIDNEAVRLSDKAPNEKPYVGLG